MKLVASANLGAGTDTRQVLHVRNTKCGMLVGVSGPFSLRWPAFD